MTAINVKDDLLIRWIKATGKDRKNFPEFVNEQVEGGIEKLENK